MVATNDADRPLGTLVLQVAARSLRLPAQLASCSFHDDAVKPRQLIRCRISNRYVPLLL